MTALAVLISCCPLSIPFENLRGVAEKLQRGVMQSLSRRAEGKELRAAEAGGKNSRRAAAGSEL